MSSRRRTRLGALTVAALAGAVLAGGCATTVSGQPTVDGSALLSGAFSSAATEGTGATGGTGVTTGGSGTLPSTLSFNLPAPPTRTTTASTPAPTVAPSTSSSESSPTRATESVPTTAPSVGGVSIDKIIAQLAADPLVVDDDAKKAADPAALAALNTQIADARAAGFRVTVVLIGHEVDDLSQLTDTVSQRTNSTSIAVSTSHFAVSSKDFTSAQLGTAENAAAQTSTPVDAAAALITSLMAQRAPGTTTG